MAEAEALGLADRTPDPLVLGRHLMARGLEPGPHFGRILARCFEAQLEGTFTDEGGGLVYLDKILKN